MTVRYLEDLHKRMLKIWADILDFELTTLYAVTTLKGETLILSTYFHLLGYIQRAKKETADDKSGP